MWWISNTCCKICLNLQLCPRAGQKRGGEGTVLVLFQALFDFIKDRVKDFVRQYPTTVLLPSSFQGKRILFFLHSTMISNDCSLFFSVASGLETNAGTLLLPLSDSQQQRSISSVLKDDVDSGLSRSSVSGLPVDTFKDFTHMSLLLKYFQQTLLKKLQS